MKIEEGKIGQKIRFIKIPKNSSLVDLMNKNYGKETEMYISAIGETYFLVSSETNSHENYACMPDEVEPVNELIELKPTKELSKQLGLPFNEKIQITLTHDENGGINVNVESDIESLFTVLGVLKYSTQLIENTINGQAKQKN